MGTPRQLKNLSDLEQTNKTLVVLIYVLTKHKGIGILRKLTSDIETKSIPMEFMCYEDREFCLSPCYCFLNTNNGT